MLAILWFFGFGAVRFALDLKVDNQKIDLSTDDR